MKANFKLILELINKTDIALSDVLNANNPKEAQANFLVSTERTPNFKYDGVHNLSAEVFTKNLKTLAELERQIATSEYLDEGERKLLRLCLEDSRLKNQCALAAEQFRNSSTNQFIRVHSATEFRDYSIQLYGDKVNNRLGVEWVTCLAMIKWYMQKIPKNLAYKSDQAMYEKLIQQLKQAHIDWENADLDSIYRPSDSTIARFGELVEKYFAHIFRHIPQQGEFTPQEVCDLINEIIQTEFTGKTKFKAVVSERYTMLSVNQLERIIYIPVRRAKGPYTYKTVKTIVIAHEICTHVYRGVQYEHTGLSPLYRGMPGSEIIDEGFAKSVEQSLSGAYEPAGFGHYIIITLMERVAHSDFRWAYEVYLALEYLSHCQEGESKATREKRLNETQDLAFSRVQRDTRGTSVLPNPKELVYYQGSYLAWKFIEQGIDNPKQLMHDIFESAKTDPTNPEHLEVLQKLRG